MCVCVCVFAMLCKACVRSFLLHGRFEANFFWGFAAVRCFCYPFSHPIPIKRVPKSTKPNSRVRPIDIYT